MKKIILFFQHNGVSFIFSFFGFAISCLSFALAYTTYQNNQKDKELLRAPMFVIENEFLNIDENVSYDFTDENPYIPHPGKFSLDRICFKKIEQAGDKLIEEIEGAYNSLIIDTTSPYQRGTLNKLINFGYFKVLNMGSDCISFRMESFEIWYINGKYMKLEPTEHDELNISKKQDESQSFDLSFSAIYAEDDFAMFKEFNPESLKKKSIYAKQGLINTYIPFAADLWSSTKLIIVTKNIYNEKYRQEINMHFRFNTYYTDSVLLGRVK